MARSKYEHYNKSYHWGFKNPEASLNSNNCDYFVFDIYIAGNIASAIYYSHKQKRFFFESLNLLKNENVVKEVKNEIKTNGNILLIDDQHIAYYNKITNSIMKVKIDL